MIVKHSLWYTGKHKGLRNRALAILFGWESTDDQRLIRQLVNYNELRIVCSTIEF